MHVRLLYLGVENGLKDNTAGFTIAFKYVQ